MPDEPVSPAASESRASWLKPYHFQPGQSGNPDGKAHGANGADLTKIREFCLDIVQRQPKLVRKAITASLKDPKARVAMLGIMRDSLDGRPNSESGGGPKVIVQIGMARPTASIEVLATPPALEPADAGHS